MADLPATKSSQTGEATTPDWAFVAFVTVIFTLAVALTCVQIYMQNPS
jgi:hypothetical protein